MVVAQLVERSLPTSEVRGSVTRLGDNFFTKSSPNIGWPSGLIGKTHRLSKNCCGYFSGNFWKHLCYFLFQHLVTLVHGSNLVIGKFYTQSTGMAQLKTKQKTNLSISRFLTKLKGAKSCLDMFDLMVVGHGTL